MEKAEFYYVVLIDAPREKVWRALTNAEFTRQYWHQTMVRSTWQKGARVEFLVEGSAAVEPVVGCEGEVLECNPPAHLSYTWHFPGNPACADEEPSVVSFTLEDESGATKLTVRHCRFSGPESPTYQMVAHGWPYVLAGLKTLLETGETRDFSQLAAG